MTKITQDTELKAGMKVRVNDKEKLIVRHMEVMGLLDLANFHQDGFRSSGHLRNRLIRNNAELIEDNAKVVVSAEVAEILNSAKKQCRGNIVSFMCRVNANIRRTDWIEYYGLTDEVLIAAYKNDWEVEKPKHWEAKEGEIVWFVGIDGVVSNLMVNAFTRQVISVLYESKNHFQTKEEAEAKAELIRAALRGEG